MMAPLVIVADIGGTNTRVALADGAIVRQASVAKFRNAEHPNLESVLTRYLADQDLTSVEGVCVAAAGPVSDGMAEMTNIDWTVTSPNIRAATGATQVAILNDLQAQGQALGHIAAENLRCIVDGPSKAGASMLVVGLGTGVNAAPVHNTPWGRIVAPSECGHITMPVRTDEDLALAKFVETYGTDAHGFTGVEDVLAGRGVEHIYAFVSSQAGALDPRTSAQVMAGMTAREPLALKTARHYVRVLGQELGNLAMIHLPYGGIYLIGGMSRAMAPMFAEMGLAAHFHDKGRMSHIVKDCAITIVEDDFAALTGCAVYLANGGIG
jgi:glucokinase